MLSPRMAAKTLDSGHVGTRIVWARIKGPICNIFYIVVYIPHKGRTVAPKAEDTIAQLTKLLQTVRKSECVIIGGDFNCQLQRSVQGCTGKWCMTKYENKGHGNKILDMMRAHDLSMCGRHVFQAKTEKMARKIPTLQRDLYAKRWQAQTNKTRLLVRVQSLEVNGDQH